MTTNVFQGNTITHWTSNWLTSCPFRITKTLIFYNWQKMQNLHLLIDRTVKWCTVSPNSISISSRNVLNICCLAHVTWCINCIDEIVHRLFHSWSFASYVLLECTAVMILYFFLGAEFVRKNQCTVYRASRFGVPSLTFLTSLYDSKRCL
jgi:hypothetical protein